MFVTLDTSLKVITNLQVSKVHFIALWTKPKSWHTSLWHYSIIPTFKTWKLQHITPITLPALLNGFCNLSLIPVLQPPVRICHQTFNAYKKCLLQIKKLSDPKIYFTSALSSGGKPQRAHVFIYMCFLALFVAQRFITWCE